MTDHHKSAPRLTEQDIAAALARMTPEERAFAEKLPLEEASVLVAIHAYFPEAEDITYGRS